MKKGVVAVLIILAVAVLISPAIIGRLAENSMTESLDWAARESGEVSVTTESFSRGWFSSEGRHRIELQDGDLLTAVEGMMGPSAALGVPVLIIDTKLDHGPIPLSSMSREKGSLAPGLGSAVSTLSIELPEGDVIELPGTIFSEVGLGGELKSHYELESGSFEDGDLKARWGDSNINLTTNPKSGKATFDGSLNALSFGDGADIVSLDQMTFAGQQRPTDFGISIGDIALEIAGLATASGGMTAGNVKSMSINARSELDGSDVNAEAFINAAFEQVPALGEMGFELALVLEGADAEALGRVQQALEETGEMPDPYALLGPAEPDFKQLFASGFTFNFEKLELRLPTGTVSGKLLFDFAEEDPATFDWTSLLLNTEALIDLSFPEPVVQMMMQAEPNVSMAIGSGYLVRRGDAYVIDAQLKKGLLTVNGAPIPIPLGGVP